jgi:hypothetical protein
LGGGGCVGQFSAAKLANGASVAPALRISVARGDFRMAYISVSQGFYESLIDGGMLPEIPRALTRYSANDPKFPVNNDRREFSR